MAERSSGRWTTFFRRKELEGEDFFVKFLAAVARIFEGSDEEETFRQVRSELVRVFDCDDISLFHYDPAVRPGAHDGDWTLQVKSGFGEGNRISQTDARSLPELEPGRPIAARDEQFTQKAALKTIALAFEEDAFYGCDIEQGKVVLLKDPRPEDDMGSGDLSVLAIPLRYSNQVGRVVEKTRVGVLALFKTPVRRELADLEKVLRSLLSHAIVTPSCMLKDPVTGLFTEAFLGQELERQLGLFEMTKGKLRGGFVVGMVDTLKLYKQTLESAGNVDPAEVGEKISQVMRGVAGCVVKRVSDHSLDVGETYKSGVAGRIGHEGFGAVLPLLSERELLMWAIRLSKDVIDTHFEAEELLAAGDVTVSLRVIPFQRGTPDQLWSLTRKVLLEIEEGQLKARRDPEALSEVVSTIRIFKRGRWLTTREFQHEGP
jgi:GGDEF domain-containing protein